MVAAVQSFLLNPFPSTAPPHNLKKKKKYTIVNPRSKLCKFSENHINPLSLKEFSSYSRQEGGLEDSFSSLSDFLAHQTPSGFCLDEFYASLLQLCIRERCLSLGNQIHAHIVKLNSSCDTGFLGTKLVLMYGKCGSILNAQKMFDRMPERTVFSWNAIIGGYTTNFEPFRSVELYRVMRVSGISLDAHTFPCVIKACGLLHDIHSGAEIHGLSIKLGHASNVIVMNSLVDMYAKCDCLDSAMLIFSNTIAREDIVSWNSLISCYSANGYPNEALKLFIEMLSLDHSPSTYTYVAVLQSCSCGSSFEELGMQLHASVIKSNLKHDVFVSNALMVMYARLGKISEAAMVFKVMDERDIISWNTMLSGFVQNGLYNEALWFWHEMQIAGQKPDQGSVVNMAAASGRMGNLNYGMEIHAFAIKNGLDHDLQVGNTLLDMYAKCSNPDYMDFVFKRMIYKDLISWTTIISGHAQNRSYFRALQLFRLVQTREILVDELMVGSILQACSGLKCMLLVKEVHGCVIKHEIFDRVLQNTIVDAYGECGNVEYASRVFSMIEVLDVVSWTSMMCCYYRNGLANDALRMFFSLLESKTEPDSIAFVSALTSISSLSALQKGKEIHAFLLRKGFVLEDSLASSLVDMYAACGDIENSNRVFRSIKQKDVILWTSMINAYGIHGDAETAIKLFRRIENDENVVPDHITFLALLHTCSHAGFIDEGKKLFDIMKCKYRLEPWPEHYACIIDLLCRANKLEEALEFVKEMPTKPIPAVWSAILGASSVNSNERIGEIAARKLLELDPNNPSNYVLISNVLASAGRWDDVEEIRMTMKMKGLKKEPACSWIEIGNKIHTFTSGDRSHPQSVEIYGELVKITEKLEEEGGYIAQTKFVLHNVGEGEKRRMIHHHSERLAIAYGMLKIAEGVPIRISKNLRVCGDCHTFTKLVSKLYRREIVMRDGNRFHHFKSGSCSCGDFW